MATFKILKSTPQQEKRFDCHPQFDVEVLKGTLKVGDQFVLYDTYHPCRFDIVSIATTDAGLRLEVRQPIMWPDAWKGKTVDTETGS